MVQGSRLAYTTLPKKQSKAKQKQSNNMNTGQREGRGRGHSKCGKLQRADGSSRTGSRSSLNSMLRSSHDERKCKRPSGAQFRMSHHSEHPDTSKSNQAEYHFDMHIEHTLKSQR